ncbi:MAG: alpha-E domain-containing protein, partial [Burkholderiales bacterium]|nr:alpha-E domain-containing protein [Burkholderiales bacterium]
MLSRVAEHIYWMARYVERAEDTARVINVNTHLLLDLPKKLAFGWEPLIDICGNRALFDELHDGPTERNIVKFMVGDMRNPGSIISSLDRARENARTIR